MVEEVRRGHELAHLGLERRRLAELPVGLETAEVARPHARVGGELGDRVGRQLAGVAACAGVCEHLLAAFDGRRRIVEVRRPARRGGQAVRPSGLQEEQRRRGRPGLGRAPIGRIPLRRGDQDRSDLLAAGHGVEVQQPLLGEEADIQVDAVERPQRADGVRGVFQHPRRENLVRRLVEAGQRAGGDVAVELLVVLLAALDRLLAKVAGPARDLVGVGQPQAIVEAVDRIHGARVVDHVGGHQRGVHRARPIGVHQLVHVVALVGAVHEQPIDPHVLGADRGAQVLELRMFRIGRRVQRARAHVAEAAGHADAIGPHQLGIVVIARVFIVALRIPALGRGVVERRIGEEAQTHDPGRITVVGAQGHGGRRP